MAESPPHLMTLPELAKLLGVPAASLWRLVRSGLLTAVKNGGDEPLYSDGEYQRLRLTLDLLDGGVGMAELRALAEARATERLASRTAKSIAAVIEDILGPLTARIERLRALRDDLIRARESLYRCRSCHKELDELSCRTCAAMNQDLPRVIDEFFMPPKRRE